MNTPEDGLSRWKASVDIIDSYGPFLELQFTGHGSSIHAITGPQRNGNFICLPAYDVGSELAGYEDTFWNKERLSPIIGEVDAVTIVQGLRHLQRTVE